MRPEVEQLVQAKKILQVGGMHRHLHIALTVVMFWHSYLFLDKTPSFVAESRVYDVAKLLMTEEEWGFLTFALGMVGLITSFPWPWRVRCFGAAVLALGFLFIAIVFGLGKINVPSFGLLLGATYIAAILSYRTAYIGKRFANRVDPSHPMRPLAR